MIFKLWIKTVKMLFGSINQEPFGLPKCWYYFWVPWTIYAYIIYEKGVDNFEIEHKNANFWVRGTVPPGPWRSFQVCPELREWGEGRKLMKKIVNKEIQKSFWSSSNFYYRCNKINTDSIQIFFRYEVFQNFGLSLKNQFCVLWKQFRY